MSNKIERQMVVTRIDRAYKRERVRPVSDGGDAPLGSFMAAKPDLTMTLLVLNAADDDRDVERFYPQQDFDAVSLRVPVEFARGLAIGDTIGLTIERAPRA